METDFQKFIEFANEKQAQENSFVLEALYDTFLSNLTPQEQPIIFAIGGSPGSGKTTWRRQQNSMNLHLHDMDEVMICLPDYQKDLASLGPKAAFEKWWPTAQKLARILVQYAIESRYSIVYDRTCGTEGSYFDLLHAKELGYKIQLVGLHVSRETARQRILKREKEEGRTITETILDEYRARFSALWPYYLEIVDEAKLYDTSDGSNRLIFSSQEGIKEPKIYQEFLETGAPFKEYFLKAINP